MDVQNLKREVDTLVNKIGPWTAHCIHLGGDTYTFPEPLLDSRLRQFLQIAADLIGQPLNEIRVLDLACLEAHYGVEFALHGARVVAIEGRDVNIAKGQFVKEALSLDNLQLVKDDVRKLKSRKIRDV